MPGDVVQDESLEAGGDCGASSSWITRAELSQSGNHRRHPRRSTARQGRSETGVVAPLHEEDQPGSSQDAVRASQVREQPTKCIDEVFDGRRGECGADSWQFTLENSLSHTGQQSRPGTEVVGRRALGNPRPLINSYVGECAQPLSSKQLNRSVQSSDFR